jgi:hypothetical protein
MRRLPVLVLVLATALNGCTAGPRVGVRAPQSAVASANYGEDPAPEEHPVREWLAAHPKTIACVTGACTAAALVGGLIFLAVQAGPGFIGG